MPVRINRVYTRAGDDGQTALVGGRRVPKDSPRIEAYGTVDELNSIVGLARVFNASKLRRGKNYRRLDEILRRIQNELFDLGSELATPRESFYEGMFRVGAAEVTALEKLMDECQKDLAPLSPSCCRAAARWAASSTRPARCAAAPSAACSRSRAWRTSASGRSST
jgi:cob(I)alamin adenosyltransferase